MSIDLYYMFGSPNCGAVMLTGKALGIEFNIKKVDFVNKEHHKPEFLKINPRHSLPTIVDDGYALSESRAIMVYLATKYGKDYSLYPNDAKKRGLVVQRLNFGICTLEKRLYDVYKVKVFEGNHQIIKEKIPQMKEGLEILDGYLSQTKWSAGDHITIADHSLIASCSLYYVFGVDLTPYKNVTRWYKQCQEEMPGYKEALGDGVDMYRSWAEPTLAKMG